VNDDIRVSTGYPDHPKTRKLLRRLGAEGVKAHIFLLCRIGNLRPKGSLEGFDPEDIEDTAQWDGEAGKFVQVLEEIGLLDKEGDVYTIHDWDGWQPWAVGAEERKKKARAAAKARWDRWRKQNPQGPKRPKKPAAKRQPEEEPSQAAPEKEPQGDTSKGQLVAVAEDVKVPAIIGDEEAGPGADRVLAGWNRIAKKKGLKTARRLSPGRRKKINARLKDKGWDWQAALAHLEKTLPDWELIESRRAKKTFLQGSGPGWGKDERQWVADFDFFIRGDSVDKILDGKYDPAPGELVVINGGMSKRNQEMMKEHEAGSDWASRKEEQLRGQSQSDS
jgi:hypothetical protein